jgi:hypothetical protein
MFCAFRPFGNCVLPLGEALEEPVGKPAQPPIKVLSITSITVAVDHSEPEPSCGRLAFVLAAFRAWNPEMFRLIESLSTRAGSSGDGDYWKHIRVAYAVRPAAYAGDLTGFSTSIAMREVTAGRSVIVQVGRFGSSGSSEAIPGLAYLITSVITPSDRQKPFYVVSETPIVPAR